MLRILGESEGASEKSTVTFNWPMKWELRFVVNRLGHVVKSAVFQGR